MFVILAFVLVGFALCRAMIVSVVALFFLHALR
ncbi:hypothetical protein SDC9_196459 [bioreactor metagenome]|uniref:Uncharacterized protein n=1 Tax=bioreactor metagenome TaxID=1076179 RepID=A0A645IC79_9ZZZZ